MTTSTNKKRVYVARNCTRTVGITAANAAANLAYGETIMLDEKGVIIASAALAVAAKGFKIMQGTTTPGAPLISDIIWKNKIKSVRSSKFEQQQEKKVAIGYNGTAGNIVVVSSNVYAIELEHIVKGAYTAEAFATRASYESLFTGDTAFNIALQLAQILALDYEQFDYGVRVGIISSEAGGAHLPSIDVTEGSRAVAYAGGAPAVDNVIVIPGLTGGIHRDEDNTLYKITYVDVANGFFEIDRPYQNRTQTAVAATLIADTTVGNYGITLEGEDIPKGSYKEEKQQVDFELDLFGFTTTPVTKDGTTMIGKPGYGRHDFVDTEEYWYQGEDGRNMFQNAEFQNPSLTVIPNHGYSSIEIKYFSNETINVLESNGNEKTIMVYLDRNTYALILADDATTAFGTNIQTGTGLSGVAGDSIINAINSMAVAAGVLAAIANTVPNGGNSITAGTIISTGIDV